MNAEPAAGHFYLNRLLEPLAPWLEQEGVTDIFINRPGEVWVESVTGEVTCEEVACLGNGELERLARQVAAATHQGVSRAHPLLAATLPDGARVQFVLPPATREHVSLSIRRHLVRDLRLGDYAARGAFPSSPLNSTSDARALLDLEQRGDLAGLLALAVRQRRNILISGGTSSGKTTFLNALISEIPESERLILIEDTPELQFSHPNAVGLVAVRGELGESAVSADDLLMASLRMRPDRIILGELRGSEAFTYLRAVSTGHPGSMTTIHADSPDRAVEQLAMLVLQRGVQLGRADIFEYVHSVVDLYVQLERGADGRRIREVRLARHLALAAKAKERRVATNSVCSLSP